MRVLSFFLALSILFSSCMSSTVIDSIPSKADIYIDGEYRGKTPVVYSDAKIMGSETLIVLRKEGYEDLETLMFRDERFEWTACAGAIYFIIPVLWIMGYEERHVYKLQALPVEEKKQEEKKEEEKKQEENKTETTPENKKEEPVKDTTENKPKVLPKKKEEEKKEGDDLPDEEDIDSE